MAELLLIDQVKIPQLRLQVLDLLLFHEVEQFILHSLNILGSGGGLTFDQQWFDIVLHFGHFLGVLVDLGKFAWREDRV